MTLTDRFFLGKVNRKRELLVAVKGCYGRTTACPTSFSRISISDDIDIHGIRIMPRPGHVTRRGRRHAGRSLTAGTAGKHGRENRERTIDHVVPNPTLRKKSPTEGGSTADRTRREDEKGTEETPRHANEKEKGFFTKGRSGVLVCIMV